MLLIGSIGLLLSGIIALLIGLSLTSGSWKDSLTRQVEAARVLVFIRAEGPEALTRTWQALNIEIPAPAVSANAVSYEWVLLAGSGSTSWVLKTHQADGSSVLSGTAESNTLLTEKQLGESFAYISDIRLHGLGPKEEWVWTRIGQIPLFKSEGGTILSALAGKATSAIITWNQTGGTVLFPNSGYGTQRVQHPNFPFPGTPLFASNITSPLSAWKGLNASLAIKDPVLAQGMDGIIRHQVSLYAATNDIDARAEALLAGPLSFFVIKKEETVGFLVVAKAKDEASILSWADDLAEAASPGIVRAQVFENRDRRTDVIAGSGAVQQTSTNGWNIRTIGNTGSVLRLTLAWRGNTFVVSDSAAMVQQSISAHFEWRNTTETAFGATQIPWLLPTLQEKMPFLSKDIVPEVNSLLDPQSHLLNWNIRMTGNDTEIEWKVLP